MNSSEKSTSSSETWLPADALEIGLSILRRKTNLPCVTMLVQADVTFIIEHVAGQGESHASAIPTPSSWNIGCSINFCRSYMPNEACVTKLQVTCIGHNFMLEGGPSLWPNTGTLISVVCLTERRSDDVCFCTGHRMRAKATTCDIIAYKVQQKFIPLDVENSFWMVSRAMIA